MVIEFIKSLYIQIISVALIGYLIGSISFPIIITRIFTKNQDIRNMGSGNAGFTNVLRSVGVLPAIITFLGDFFKCIIAIFIARYIFSTSNFSYLPSFYVCQYGAYIAGIACIIGHIYPCFFKFRGGKSIVASFSMMVATHWQVGLIILIIFLIVLLLSKIVSLSSIICAMSYPLVNIISLKYWVFRNVNTDQCVNYIVFTTFSSFFVMGIVVYKHKENIKRLLNGTEKKISTKKYK